MGRGVPELAALELLPVEPEGDRHVAAVIVEKEQPPVLRWGLQWFLRFDTSRPDQLGTELAVRRRIHAGIEASLPAVLAVAQEEQRTHRHGARLDVHVGAARHEGGVLRIPARLHGAWLALAVPVELDLEAWSSTQCELRLQSRRRHGGAHPSARYFDAAHDVLDALRDAVEDRIVEAFKA